MKAAANERALAADAERKALQSAIDAQDVQAVARLVVEGTSTQVRQAAAEAISDLEVLRQLIRDVRGGKDNRVYKILTSKRDALLEQARSLEQVQAEIISVAEALERHSRRPYDVFSAPRLEDFERRWNAVVGHAEPELRERVQHWIECSKGIIAEHAQQLAAQAAREQAAADAAAEARRQREAQAQASAAAEAEQEQVLAEQQHERDEKQKVEQQAVRQLDDLIRKARAALAGGSSARAAGLRRNIEQMLAGAPPLPAKLAGQLQQLDQQLDELKDWKRFSVAPKRAELIEAMASLIDAEVEPQALAERIHSLQEQWRSLSKGAGDEAEAEADWQRFKAAADQAYRPCKAYFAEQALIREQNLQRREGLLAGLTTFEAEFNWEQPNWQTVIKTLRETKQEWRNCAPVDRQASRRQERAFTDILARLQGRLDAAYASNQQQKESLIERARQLTAGDDSRKAIDAVKELQKLWQATGPVPREVDQRLWGQFRQHCDAVFQKRDQALADHAAGLEGNKAQALALCEQVEQIATLEDVEVRARAGTLSELKGAFEALGELPRADARALRSRLERGLEDCRKRIAREEARDAERSWADLFDAANQVRAYRLAAVQGAETESLAALKAAVERFVASVSRWPKGGLEALRQALTDVPSADLAANEAALRMICIRAEILLDLPTPSEDQALRRDYQLQRLVQSMGQGSRTDNKPLDAMALEWITTGPVADAAYEPLLQRFQHCRTRRDASGA